MSVRVQDWEGVARDLLERTGTDDPPVDAFLVADCWGFEVRPAAVRDAEIDIDRRLILLNTRAQLERQHMSIAHELGHWGLLRAGLPNLERGAKYVGGAIMGPRARFDRDLRTVGWSILKLREIHRHSSAIAIAVRITQLRDAIATVIDPHNREPPWRVPSPWIDDPRITKRVSRWERDLARRAYESGAIVHESSTAYALPVHDDADAPGEDRVIVVCELEQLSLRLAR